MVKSPLVVLLKIQGTQKSEKVRRLR
jgi:hypothetical protein